MDNNERLRAYLSAVVDLGKLALSDIRPELFFQPVVERVAEATDVPYAKILLSDKETGDLRVVAGVGWRPGVVGRARLPGSLRSPSGRAFLTGEPVTVSDLEQDTEHDLPDLLREHGIRSLLNVPIRSETATYGVLEVDRREPHRFTRDKRLFLISIAVLIAAAIERHRAVEAHRAAAVMAATEREVLMRELQHRVGNNLQGLFGLLRKNRSAARTQHSRDLIGEALTVVESMMDAHVQLTGGESDHVVAIGPYLRRLCAVLVPLNSPIRVETAIADADVSVKQAVTAGLLVNEITTNSLKHAFGDGRPGVICVEFLAKDGELVLTVSDNGSGFTEAAGNGQGLGLIASLAAQIQARLHRDRPESGGTRYRISFRAADPDNPSSPAEAAASPG